jgi:hypothetical protein
MSIFGVSGGGGLSSVSLVGFHSRVCFINNVRISAFGMSGGGLRSVRLSRMSVFGVSGGGGSVRLRRMSFINNVLISTFGVSCSCRSVSLMGLLGLINRFLIADLGCGGGVGLMGSLGGLVNWMLFLNDLSGVDFVNFMGSIAGLVDGFSIFDYGSGGGRRRLSVSLINRMLFNFNHFLDCYSMSLIGNDSLSG